jgi:hypothetical protein
MGSHQCFVTVRLTEVEWLRAPEVPLMVTVDVPVGVFLPVFTVNVELPLPVIVVGLKVPVAPAGRPLTPSVTVPVNPLIAVTVAVYVVLPPCFTV